MAKLYFRYGAMNSGKSTALMQVAHNYEEQGMRVLILKPKVDTKGSGDLVSRLGVRRPADLLVPPDMDLVEAVRAASSEGRPLACVLCDESQFLTAEQAEQLFMVTVELNIPVICYGLRSDFSLKGFPGSTRLLELAHTIEEMKTICTCGRKATCNCRKVNGRFVFEGEQVAIDLENDVQYVSMCPQCFFLILCRPHAGRHFCIFSASVIYQSRSNSRVFCAIDISAQGRNFLLSSLLMYTTLFQQILPRLQNSCNSGQSSPVASQFSMQIVEVYKLHSFSVQVYSLWQ